MDISRPKNGAQDDQFISCVRKLSFLDYDKTMSFAGVLYIFSNSTNSKVNSDFLYLISKIGLILVK